jgi:AbrB family looped-hinge helix DNA binding protein
MHHFRSNTMNELTTSMTRKGQVTVPIQVRRLLGLKPRDRVSFIVGDDGVRIERAASGLDAIAGSVKPRKRPEDFKELRRVATQEAAQRALEDA